MPAHCSLLPVACAACRLPACSYQHLAPLLVHNGVVIGHMVHAAGAVCTACCVAGVLHVIQCMRKAMAEKRAEEQRKAEAANQEEMVARVLNTVGQAAAKLGKNLQ